jgi:NADH:ubiquinone oxidoreductase subunit E
MDIQKVLQEYPKEQEYLIEILIDIDTQKHDHFISEWELEQVANYLQVKISHVCSVMSFYTLLSTEPRGRYIIQVCNSVPCYLNDDFNVLLTVEDILGIRCGQTTKDDVFTLETTACIGCCDEAPAMRINNQVYTNLTEDLVYDIIKQYKEGYHD